MEIRFYFDLVTDQPYIWGHHVYEAEVRKVVRSPGKICRRYFREPNPNSSNPSRV